MKRVIMAEKRNAAEDIAKAIGIKNTDRKGRSGFIHGYDRDGSEIVITWSNGHAMELVEPEEIDPKYKRWSVEDLPIPYLNDNSLLVIPEKRNLFKDIMEELKDADDIVNAGDAGREGELIQRWILKTALDQPKDIYRLWVQSLTEKSIREAYENLLGTTEEERERLDDLYDSGRARAIMDKYTGYNYSRLITLTKTDGVTVNYGRCKSPLVHAICERDKEIEDFISVPFKYISLVLDKDGESFKAVLVDEDNSRKEFLEGEEKEANDTFRTIPEYVKVTSIERKPKRAMPPAPFDTLQIQKEMSNMYGYEANYTLDILEKLYDTHHILSYPRTEARVFSEDLKSELRAVLSSLEFEPFTKYVEKAKEGSIPDKYFNNKKIADHHALCPVTEGDLETKYRKLSEPERNVYDHIIKNFIALHLPAYEYEAVEAISEGSGHRFITKGKKILDPGYKAIYMTGNKGSDEEDEENQTIPDLTEGNEVRVEEKKIIDSKTKPKSRFTTASILDFMKLNNIGTGATRHRLIEELTEKKGVNKESYVVKDGKYFVSTAFGRKIDNIIPDDIKSIEYVKNLEKRINAIAEGKDSYKSFIEDMEKDFYKKLDEMKRNSSVKLVSENNRNFKSTGMKCPHCGQDMRDVGWGYSCSRWKKDGSGCNFSIGKKLYGKTVTEKVISQLINDRITKSELKNLKGKTGKPFNAYLTLSIADDGKAKVGVEFKK